MKNKIKKGFEKVQGLKTHWRISIWSIVSLLIIFIIGSGAMIAHGSLYVGKTLPGIHVGEFNMTGMDQDEVLAFLENLTKKRMKEGVQISFDSPDGVKEFNLTPGLSKDDSGFDVSMDLQSDAERIFSYGKVGNRVIDSWSALVTKWIEPNLELKSFNIDKDSFTENIKTALDEYITEPVNARVKISDVDPLDYVITTSSPGLSFTYDDAYTSAMENWQELQVANVVITSFIDSPTYTKDDLVSIEKQLDNIFGLGKHAITYFDEHTKRNHSWTITEKMLGEWITPMRTNAEDESITTFGVDASSTIAFLNEEVVPEIEVEPVDAVFELNSSGTKATKIIGHRPGITVDVDMVYADINQALLSRIDNEIDDIDPVLETELAVSVVEPDVTLAETNDLGITEILGQGSSDFSGSPRNRILNIKNAVYNKLHGTIIKPDQEFSLNNTLRPYTLAAGYLPELVIVGNRIKPEVAGGLCQVGTTMFRTAMRSAMPITQRVNHGLVVDYYNDATNGNPGTDATIYDGWPDFRFKNDTGAHMVVTTYMNTKTGELTFRLWGTSDGRKGSYTPPVVTQWIGAGPYKEIETTDLAPGEKQCQGVHPGAKASFTYTRTLPNGEIVNRVFNSEYRAVPATCYVGVEKLSQCQEDGSGEGCSTSDKPEAKEDQTKLDSILEEDFGILPADE